MYLKSIELVGFKSFSGKTKLEFERGMTSIVGPNGCGKSNLADAVRWVLGEQSAKALRGAKMQDVIFSGTDAHKPLGMAEVSLTLAECESNLATEFHEVTVTRRVFRSGEGQYFINRTPCRLKDIQRLFMDTGIGTNSYSLMEQGRIDLILSSRPDDRRAVFEEASGITKFKADKKEALRKLEHTEANLLRLEDIIREVRRQIISLQRQAGKARRYQEMQEKLRGYDIYFTRKRIRALEKDVQRLENSVTSLREQEEAARADTAALEQQTAEARDRNEGMERAIGEIMEAVGEARSRRERAVELIRVNRDRIEELRALSERDARDASESRKRLEQHGQALAAAEKGMSSAREERDAAEAELTDRQQHMAELNGRFEELESRLHQLRTELIDVERRTANRQNELTELEAAERTTVLRRERLAAEQGEMRRSVSVFAEREERMQGRLCELQAQVDAREARLSELAGERQALSGRLAEGRQALGERRTTLAARQAQSEMIEHRVQQGEDFPGGARHLLSQRGTAPDGLAPVVGSLVEFLHVDDDWRTATEAALRSWLDAVLVRDETEGMAWLKHLFGAQCGSARILALDSAAPPPAAAADLPHPRLLDHLQCDASVRPVLERLLGNVYLVPDLDSVPSPLPARVVVVTRDGAVRRGDGSFECWMPGEQDGNPLAQRQALAEAQHDVAGLEEQVVALQAELGTLQRKDEKLLEVMTQGTAAAQGARRDLAVCEGEFQVVSQEGAQARDRLETVTFELDALLRDGDSSDRRRTEIQEALAQFRGRQDEIRERIAETTEALRTLGRERNEAQSQVSECRIAFAEYRQKFAYQESQRTSLEARVTELTQLIAERESGLTSYQARMEELERARAEAEARLGPMEAEIVGLQEELDRVRSQRRELSEELTALETQQREKRTYLDGLQERRSRIDVELAQQQMRLQTQTERITADYQITLEAVMKHPEPEWDQDTAPDLEAVETTIAELRTKLDSMGPVNLVAIEEHRELEERYAFLTQQQDDLVKAKQQLLDLIRRINKTTTEMFSATFRQVNENFQAMFKQLFGGGTAKLVLVDEEDVLESGIEIIARPPGKKLQTVSLLSGGERTMAAVALLFSLYMVKPSPFCMLDELDAALDEANIGRFIETVRGFLAKSQFIVITHNRRTIAASDILYGVTMEHRGVSKIVSVKLSDHQAGRRAGAPAGAGQPEEATT